VQLRGHRPRGPLARGVMHAGARGEHQRCRRGCWAGAAFHDEVFVGAAARLCRGAELFRCKGASLSAMRDQTEGLWRFLGVVIVGLTARGGRTDCLMPAEHSHVNHGIGSLAYLSPNHYLRR
jgi:hypothetical protein